MTPFAALLGLTITLHQDTAQHARAESLLALGREWLAHPVWGRFPAESAFRRASELEPLNPEPLYYLGKVGLYLGGDDGEMIARPALVRMLALQPDFRDGWALWKQLYRGRTERREAVRALAAHSGFFIADLRRAELLIELRRQDSASALLRDLARRSPADPAPLALLAESRFEAGDDSTGMRAYADAITLADNDTSGILWRQVRSIATPAERQRFAALKPGQHAAFFRSFWSYRDPDLRTILNERVGEHFRRYAEAQADFALLHPNARYHHSAQWRALAGGLGMLPGPEMGMLVDQTANAMCGARLPSVRDTTVRSGLGRQVEQSDSTSPNLEDGLDDRGRIWVRYGQPTLRFRFGADAETWCYDTGEGMLRVTFLRRTGGWGASGDLVVTPVIAGEAESAWRLLTTDRPTIPTGRLTFSFWPATFRIEAGVKTELVLFPDSVGAVAELVDENGIQVARDTATDGALRLAAAPGAYMLLMDGRRGRNTGRYRGSVVLPAYAPGGVTISGILIAGGGIGATRDSMEAAATGSLRFRASQPLRVYAEVYGLQPQGGAVTYEATYRFERLDRGFLGLFGGNRVTTVTFHRVVPAAESHVESVRLDPGRLARGRYRLVLQVRDPARALTVATTSVQFELR